MGDASAALNVGTGSSVVLGRLSMLLESVDSFRSEARIQPFCTKVSIPSGRTSLTVACRSTSGVDDRTHRCTAPLPTTVVVSVSGSVTKETDVPAGFCCQFHCHCEALPHSPPPPVRVPKSVRGSALASAVKDFTPLVAAAVALSVPPDPRYQVRAAVPGTGKAEKSLAYPGIGSPGP